MDAGAHLGYLTLFLSQLVGDSGRVASFEPVAENFRVLEENIRVNHVKNVELRNAALLDRTGPINMVRVTQQTLSWSPSAVNQSIDPRLSSVASQAMTLDEFILGTKRLPKFIKIDVEGAELHVLRGAVNTLANVCPLLFLEIHSWGSPASKEVLSFLAEQNYTPQIIGSRGDEAFCFAVPTAQQASLQEILDAARI
ncbi:MAG: FkbM family methyltransferase [Acidobacteria bacterium]|nr:FkbM family methyltransferase [Acidobacteriota bacterium]